MDNISQEFSCFLIRMCLDIEHSIKVDLIRKVQNCNRYDAYQVVQDFVSNQQKWHYSDPEGTEYIDKILTEARKDVYRKNLVEKYENNFPIWVFAEIIHFSDLIELYMFIICHYICNQCTEIKDEKRLPNGCYPISSGSISAYRAYKITNNKENDRIKICPQIRKKVEQLDRLLQDVRHLRNAAAHNSCFLNDLRIPKGNGDDDSPSPLVTEAFKQTMDKLQSKIPTMTSKRISKILKNERLRQLFSVLYAHRLLVQSKGIKDNRWKELKDFTDNRLYKSFEYYKECSSIVKVFELLKNTIDIWSNL